MIRGNRDAHIPIKRQNICWHNSMWTKESKKMIFGSQEDVFNTGYIPIESVELILSEKKLYKIKFLGFSDNLEFVEESDWVPLKKITYGTIEKLLPNSKRLKMHLQSISGSDVAILANNVEDDVMVFGNIGIEKPENILDSESFNLKFQVCAYSECLALHDGIKGTVINTAEHYEYAARHSGFDGIKGDVRITKDNHLVMCHDAGFTLDENGKITKYERKNSTDIRDMTYDEVMNLTHAVQFEGKDVSPAGIDIFLHTAKKYGKYPYITIRDEYIDEIAPIVVEKVRKYGLEKVTIVNSFTYSSLLAIRKLSKHIALSFVQELYYLLSEDMVIQMKDLAPGMVTIFDSDGYNLDKKDQLRATEYAKKCDVKLFGALLVNTSIMDRFIDYGFAGCQAYMPFE